MGASESDSGKDDKGGQRGQWGNQIEFILACVGYAVGLGNVWRFPYLCYKNGGGAFLIPYGISLVISGLPIFYLELSLGQFSSLGPNCIFGKLAPIAQGIGWGMVVVSAMVALYYNMIIAWVLFYFFASFRSDLQWSSCLNTFDGFAYTNSCYTVKDQDVCTSKGEVYYNKTCWENGTLDDSVFNATRTSASEEYFERYMLNLSGGFEEIGPVQWKLALSLLCAWIIIFLCLMKGVQSTGKVVYFTATFPYIVLVILLIRGCTLKGAWEGIRFYITPTWAKLLDIGVWKDAATQIFYSLGPAFGGLLTMSSYNSFHNNCHRDALFVAITNCATSIFAGFAIFSVAGFMAVSQGVPVDKVVKDGAGLAFIAYPEAIAQMPASPLWSILFFFMLFTLGLDSQFAMLETVTTAMMDQFVGLRKYKTTVVGVACALMFLLGLPLCTRGGMYIFTLINDYSASYCLIMLGLFEVVTVCHIYGIKNFKKDIEMMLGKPRGPIGYIIGPSGWYWMVTWFFFTPIFLVVILALSFKDYQSSKYGDYRFPPLADGMGWVLAACSIACIPAFAIAAIIRHRSKGFAWLWKATPEWCPASEREKRAAQAEAAAHYYTTQAKY